MSLTGFNEVYSSNYRLIFQQFVKILHFITDYFLHFSRQRISPHYLLPLSFTLQLIFVNFSAVPTKRLAQYKASQKLPKLNQPILSVNVYTTLILQTRASLVDVYGVISYYRRLQTCGSAWRQSRVYDLYVAIMSTGHLNFIIGLGQASTMQTSCVSNWLHSDY